MKVENGVIIEATEEELLDYWLSRDLCKIYTFPNYKTMCEMKGTKIVKKKGEMCQYEYGIQYKEKEIQEWIEFTRTFNVLGYAKRDCENAKKRNPNTEFRVVRRKVSEWEVVI